MEVHCSISEPHHPHLGTEEAGEHRLMPVRPRVSSGLMPYLCLVYGSPHGPTGPPPKADWMRPPLSFQHIGLPRTRGLEPQVRAPHIHAECRLSRQIGRLAFTEDSELPPLVGAVERLLFRLLLVGVLALQRRPSGGPCSCSSWPKRGPCYSNRNNRGDAGCET